MDCNHMKLFIFLLFHGHIYLASGFFFEYYTKIKCSYYECCNEDYVPQDVRELQRRLNASVFGQEIAIDTIMQALFAHVNSEYAPKALAMSFHGPSGTGKTFVSHIIADTFYKKGHLSNYFHFMNGRSDLPQESEINRYKEELLKRVVNSLIECPRSLFIFDEIDSMPTGVLNILVPLLDYGKPRVWPYSSNRVVDTRKAIFIFISNSGSTSIIGKLIELYRSGNSRIEMHRSDFEKLISTGAFNEAGGFHKSDTISNNLIDHYVPFLPLELEHVKLCIEAAFQIYGRSQSTIEELEEVLSFLQFGPTPDNLFAVSGCKRIETKIASIVYKRGLHNEL